MKITSTKTTYLLSAGWKAITMAAATAILLLPFLVTSDASATVTTACLSEAGCGGPGSCPGGTTCARNITNVTGCCIVSEAFCASSCVTPMPWFFLCPNGFCSSGNISNDGDSSLAEASSMASGPGCEAAMTLQQQGETAEEDGASAPALALSSRTAP